MRFFSLHKIKYPFHENKNRPNRIKTQNIFYVHCIFHYVLNAWNSNTLCITLQTYWLIRCLREHTTSMPNFHPFPKFHGLIPEKFLIVVNSCLPLKKIPSFPQKWVWAWMYALVMSGRTRVEYPPPLMWATTSCQTSPTQISLPGFRNTIWLSSSKAPDNYLKICSVHLFANLDFTQLNFKYHGSVKFITSPFLPDAPVHVL